MRLTAELLLSVNGHLNALKDRECMLRGMGISAIENLAVLQDQFDLIDLSDNEILKLENLPRIKRLSAIFLANNSVSRVSKGLGAMVPQMKVLDLTKNQLRNLSEIKNISEFQQLEHLSLAGNPVALKPNYRLFVISCMKTLKFLDFQRVTETERQSARELFSGAQGAELMKAVDEEATAEVEGGAAPQLTAEEKAQVRAAISAAVSKADLDRIELQVQTGTFPFQKDGAEKEALAEQDEQEKKSKGGRNGGEAASAAGGDETAATPAAAAAAAADTDMVGKGKQSKPTSPADTGRRSRSASQSSSVGDGDDKGEKEAKQQAKGDKTAAAAAAKKGAAKKAPARGKRAASIDDTAQQQQQQQHQEEEENGKEEKKPAGRKRKQSEDAAAEEQEQDAEVEADAKPKRGRAAAKPKEEKAKKAPATKRAKRK
jgi:U2 small nuclear ribonucleoprotein A'